MKYTKSLTGKQKKVLDSIAEYINEKKKSPTIEEIKNKLNFKSTRSVSQYLEFLVRKGYIRKNRNPRSIELVNYYENVGNETVLIPLFNLASCGTPEFFASDNIEEHISVDKNLLKRKKDNYYIVKASGKSMTGIGIEDSSLVLVEKKDYYNDGENVVVIIDGMAVIKRVIKGELAISLIPVSLEKEKYKPIIVKDNFSIAGKVVCTIPDSSCSDDIRIIPINDNE